MFVAASDWSNVVVVIWLQFTFKFRKGCPLTHSPRRWPCRRLHRPRWSPMGGLRLVVVYPDSLTPIRWARQARGRPLMRGRRRRTKLICRWLMLRRLWRQRHGDEWSTRGVNVGCRMDVRHRVDVHNMPTRWWPKWRRCHPQHLVFTRVVCKMCEIWKSCTIFPPRISS